MTTSPAPQPPQQRGLWLTRIAVAFYAILPFVLLIGGVQSLDQVVDSASRTILGFFVLTGFLGMLAFAHFITKGDQKKLRDWAWERKLHKIVQASKKAEK